MKPNFNFVIVESPFKGRDQFEEDIHKQYLKICLQDCIQRGENPFASHGFYTHFLNDNNTTERNIGISCGIAYYSFIKKCAIYNDLGISTGMDLGIKYAKEQGCQIEFRSLQYSEQVKRLMFYKEIINESRKSVDQSNS